MSQLRWFVQFLYASTRFHSRVVSFSVCRSQILTLKTASHFWKGSNTISFSALPLLLPVPINVGLFLSLHWASITCQPWCSLRLRSHEASGEHLLPSSSKLLSLLPPFTSLIQPQHQPCSSNLSINNFLPTSLDSYRHLASQHTTQHIEQLQPCLPRQMLTRP